MHIAVVGPGGAGGYFAARWAAAGHDVTVVARGDHLDAIRSQGLRVASPLGDVVAHPTAVASIAEVAACQAICVATKSWQLPVVAESLGGGSHPGTPVFGVQNGVESVEVLARARDPSTVLGATCRLIGFVAAPGVVRHAGADPALLVGDASGGSSPRTSEIAAELDVPMLLQVRAVPDIRQEIWRKLLFFSPVSGIGSVARAPIGVVRAQPETRRLLEAAMGEVAAVADAEGVRLAGDSVAEALGFVDSLPEAGTSSMQRDFQAGRRTELDALAGAVRRLGRRHGVPTPVHDFVYGALLPLERRARGELRWTEVG